MVGVLLTVGCGALSPLKPPERAKVDEVAGR